MFILLAHSLGQKRLTFDFLSGHGPIRPSAEEMREARLIGGDLSYYSFKRDSSSFRKLATAELLRRGFKELAEYRMEFSSGYILWFARGEIAKLKSNPKRMPDVETVILMDGVRYRAVGKKWSDNARYLEGWVTVAVGWPRDASILDAFRDWLG